MTRILHLSDLHFGFHRDELIPPLLKRIHSTGADLAVITGDLTHRALPWQFAQARAFLDRLGCAWIAVPGNHDLPLFNPVTRLLDAFSPYREAIGGNLAPVARVGETRVFGLNSADPLAWQRGAIRRAELDRTIAGMVPGRVDVIALHHPLRHRPGVDKLLSRGARRTVAALQSASPSIVLSGHLHVWSAGALSGQGADRLLDIQAGTTLCARISDARNEFAVLQIDGPDLTIERHIAPMDEADFHPPEYLRFSCRSGQWQPCGHDPDQDAEDLPTDPGATDTAFNIA